MSIFGKLFGARSLEEERAEAEALFARGDFGSAKLAYERALAKAKDPTTQQALAQQVNACRDALARQHLEAAEQYLQSGERELAREELQQVQQISEDPQLLRQVEDRLDQLERVSVHEEVAAHFAPDEADRFELIAGGFESDQYAEYVAHGEQVQHALLLLHSGEDNGAQQALQLLEAAIQHADAPRYLWFELGRARLACGKTLEAEAALTQFLSTLHAEEGGDARLIAHHELASIARERGDFEGAVAHYESALIALPDDPRPYLALANFFRREKMPEEAIEVLEAAQEAFQQKRPDFRIWQELGLSLADAGRDAQAIEWLERMVSALSSQHMTDLPPDGTVRLAELHERAGNKSRALDLFALLAQGSDRANLCLYHEQAARLLLDLGLHDDAHRMLVRARELAPNDPEIRERLEKVLHALTTRGANAVAAITPER